MKKFVISISLLIGIFLSSLSAFAQDDAKYGDNPDQCRQDLSEYIEFVKQKNYLDALPAWKRVYNACPQSSKSIFLNGPKIMAALIKQEPDKAKKLLYVDTLMQIYDKRIELFGQEGNVLGRKGNDLYKYNPNKWFYASFHYILQN